MPVAATGFAELDAVLQLLLDGSREVFGDNLIGLYLHGSLAAGDFNPATSDVDFVVILHSPVGEDQWPELKRVFEALLALDPGWASRLEGCFMPAHAFAEEDTGRAYPCYDEGEFLLNHKGINNALQRHILREQGIVLTGPAARKFIAPVSVGELQAESLGILHNWWQPQLRNQVNLRDRIYQAYAVLTMCRISYTLETGAIASKPRAAAWLRQRQPDWAALIARALACHKSDAVDDLEDTLRLISATVEAYPR